MANRNEIGGSELQESMGVIEGLGRTCSLRLVVAQAYAPSSALIRL